MVALIVSACKSLLKIYYHPSIPTLQAAARMLKNWERRKINYYGMQTAIASSNILSSSSTSHPKQREDSNPQEYSESQEYSEPQPKRARLAKSSNKAIVDESEDDAPYDREDLQVEDDEGDEEAEFGGALNKYKPSATSATTISSAKALNPTQFEDNPTIDIETRIEPPSLSLELEDGMDDKKALKTALEASWQYLTEIDTFNAFAAPVCCPNVTCILPPVSLFLFPETRKNILQFLFLDVSSGMNPMYFLFLFLDHFTLFLCTMAALILIRLSYAYLFIDCVLRF